MTSCYSQWFTVSELMDIDQRLSMVVSKLEKGPDLQTRTGKYWDSAQWHVDCMHGKAMQDDVAGGPGRLHVGALWWII